MPDVFEILAEPRRTAILRLVWTQEKSAGEIAKQFEVTFGAVSQHLAILRGAGLIGHRKHGRQRFYKANREALGPIAQYLESIWAPRLAKLKAAAEREERWKKSKSR